MKIIEDHVAKLTDEKEALDLKVDGHEISKEELQNQINHLEFQIEQSNVKLQVP